MTRGLLATGGLVAFALATAAVADVRVEPFGTANVCAFSPQFHHTITGNAQAPSVFQGDCRLILAIGTDVVTFDLPAGATVRQVSVTVRDYCSPGCSHLKAYNASGASFDRPNTRVNGSAPEVLSISDSILPGITSIELRSFEAYFDDLAITFDAPTPCPADFNGNGLSTADIFDFVNAWLAGNAAADFNGGGMHVSDIFDFLNAWLAGCP